MLLINFANTKRIFASIYFCVLAVTLNACKVPLLESSQTSEQETSIEQVQDRDQIPLLQLSLLFDRKDRLFQLAAPIAIEGYQIQLIDLGVDGEPQVTSYDVPLFPADVYAVLLPNNETKVLLARSPVSGCPVQWYYEYEYFQADCDGSKFRLDGTYIEGPSPRSLDELPTRIEDGMIWITSTIKYGDPVSAIQR